MFITDVQFLASLFLYRRVNSDERDTYIRNTCGSRSILYSRHFTETELVKRTMTLRFQITNKDGNCEHFANKAAVHAVEQSTYVCTFLLILVKVYVSWLL